MKRIFKVGDAYEMVRRFSADDVQKFADVSGDHNRVHFAATPPFPKPIAHGMLVGSMFSVMLGMSFLGQGSIYVSQNFQFTNPVFLDEQVTAKVLITSIRLKRDVPLITLKTVVVKEDGKIAINGDGCAYCPHLKGCAEEGTLQTDDSNAGPARSISSNL
eukprot:ANDGO_04269.mRNA.1 (R)-specific enoyl-CoA hydratase